MDSFASIYSQNVWFGHFWFPLVVQHNLHERLLGCLNSFSGWYFLWYIFHLFSTYLFDPLWQCIAICTRGSQDVWRQRIWVGTLLVLRYWKAWILGENTPSLWNTNWEEIDLDWGGILNRRNILKTYSWLVFESRQICLFGENINNQTAVNCMSITQYFGYKLFTELSNLIKTGFDLYHFLSSGISTPLSHVQHTSAK